MHLLFSVICLALLILIVFYVQTREHFQTNCKMARRVDAALKTDGNAVLLFRFTVKSVARRSGGSTIARSIMATNKTSSGVPFSVDLGSDRIKYKDKNDTFTEDQLASKEPFGQFAAWFDVAKKTPGIHEPNAMLLGTATKEGIPSVRPVLLKGFSSDEGFKFYTNYESRKGRELAENPRAALTFYWGPLYRTVRIEGCVEKTSSEDSDRYFGSRPFSSQIGACASRQSAVIASRDSLVVKERELLARYAEGKVDRPECWGGYVVIPSSIEFWQGQSDRLHDRIRFRRAKTDEKIDNILVHRGDDGWVYERLSP